MALFSSGCMGHGPAVFARRAARAGIIAARRRIAIPFVASELAVALAVTLALALVAACSPPRGLEAARVLGDIDAGAGPSALKRATPAPARIAVVFRAAGKLRRADLYLPGETARAALVLVPGASESGKDDPRMIAFASTLARARFAVLVPDIGELRALKLRAADAREIADAALYLAARADAAPGRPLGIAAISYAVGPALIAALEPDLGPRLGFVLGIGGYHDMTALVTFFTTGYYRERPGAGWRHREPNAYGKWVFVLSNLDRIADAGDRAVLDAMARRRLADIEAPVDDLARRLGPEGRAVHALLENRDPEKVPARIAALPAAIRAEMAALDLARRDLGRLSARLILVHGREDDIVPWSESRALAGAVAPGRADLYLIDGFNHVDGGAGPLGRLQLWRAVYRLLDLRDAERAP